MISETETHVLAYIKAELPRLLDHSIGTRDFALEIYRDQLPDLDPGKVALAALCHDLARLIDPSDIVHQLESRGIDTDSLGFVTPILLHGFLSAEIAREKFGVEDREILDAIRWHATGRDRMNDLEKLIYVADKIEPNRDYPGVGDLRMAVREDFRAGFVKVIGAVIEYVVARSLPLDYNSVAAWNRALSDFDVRPAGYD